MIVALHNKNKKKSHAWLWIILILLVVAVLILLYAPKLFPEGNGFLNLRSADDFTIIDGRVYYPGAETGIDVSEHQGEIDWQSVKEDGISFAIIRMGYRGSTKGGLNVDARFYENLNGAQAVGLDTGVYFYSQANCVEEAVEEAEYVLSAVHGYTLSCPVFFDWEEGTPRSERLSDVSYSDVAEYARVFCETVRQAGYEAGVYFNQEYGYKMNVLTLRDYSLWLAEFDDSMRFYFDTQYWQYTYQGTVDGIATAVDLDLRYRTEEANEKNH